MQQKFGEEEKDEEDGADADAETKEEVRIESAEELAAQEKEDRFRDGTNIAAAIEAAAGYLPPCLLYTSPSPRDRTRSRMPSSA